jgi:hypothetical protein
MKGKLYISACEAGACTYWPEDTRYPLSLQTLDLSKRYLRIEDVERKFTRYSLLYSSYIRPLSFVTLDNFNQSEFQVGLDNYPDRLF